MLVDAHRVWLDALRIVVEKAGVEVAGATTSGRQGLELVCELEPDLLITELTMPEGEIEGITLIREARLRHPSLKAIVVSMHEEQRYVDSAVEAGAVAYVGKTARPDDLEAAVRGAFANSHHVQAAPPARSSRAATPEPDTPRLTRRELEILQLAAEGLSNAELGKRLCVTEQTIKFHLSNVYRKLGVSNRTEASRSAQVHGLLPVPAPANAGRPAGSRRLEAGR
ncbi:MAG: response regulator transcription factor [Actinobacteria bacterium]|nr:response regulator transcription factor [Actinomycetota bacterium]